MRLSVFSADSSAWTDDSRPMTNGTIMKGKITTSRMGTIESLVCSYFSFVLIVIYTFVALYLCVSHHKGYKDTKVRPSFLPSFLEWQLDFLLFDHLSGNG